MRTIFILVTLLVALFDLADCTLYNPGQISDAPGLSQAACLRPVPCYQHTKVVSADGGDIHIDQSPVIPPTLEIQPATFVSFTLMVTPEVPSHFKIAPYANLSSSGGLPG